MTGPTTDERHTLTDTIFVVTAGADLRGTCAPGPRKRRRPFRPLASQLRPRKLQRAISPTRIASPLTKPHPSSSTRSARHSSPTGSVRPSAGRLISAETTSCSKGGHQRRSRRHSHPTPVLAANARTTTSRKPPHRRGQHRALILLERPPTGCLHECGSHSVRGRATCSSPKVRISTPSTVRRRDRPRRLPSFAAIAGVAGVLAAGLIRDNLQAHLALARVGEQPPSSTPTSLPVRTTRGSAPRFAGRPALHRHETYRNPGEGEWTPVAQCARSERPTRRLCRSDEPGSRRARSVQASVRRRWRE